MRLKPSKKLIYIVKSPFSYNEASMDRRNHNGAGFTTIGLTNAQITTLKGNYAKDLNIDGRITKFSKQLQNEHVYRIPLRYFSDIGKINFPTKIDYRIKLFLESDMKKLLESKKSYSCQYSYFSTRCSNYFYTSALYSIRTNFVR